MILDFIEHQGILFAVNDVGQLLIWNIAKHQNGSKYFQFQHNVSIVSTSCAQVVEKKQLLGIVKAGALTVMFSKSSLFSFFLKNKVEDYEEQSPLSIKEINMNAIIQQDQISCVVALNSETVVIGTSRGGLIRYNVGQEVLEGKVSAWDQTKKQRQTELLATSYEKSPQVTSLVAFRNNNIGLLSLDNGRIFSFELTQLKVLNQITSCLKSPLERISKLYLKEQEDKVYSVHPNYIVGWNFKLNSCLNYIECSSAQGVLKQSTSFLIIGLHPSIYLVDESVQSDEQQPKSLNLSMRGAAVIKQLGGQFFGVGGTDNLIDIFMGSSRLMTLIHK